MMMVLYWRNRCFISEELYSFRCLEASRCGKPVSVDLVLPSGRLKDVASSVHAQSFKLADWRYSCVLLRVGSYEKYVNE